jgi:hypothetical protein
MQQLFDIFALDAYNQSDKPSPGWQFYLVVFVVLAILSGKYS